MVQNSNNIERQSYTPAEKPEMKQEDHRALRETSKEFVDGVSELVDSVESGEVAEHIGEDKKKGPQGGFPVIGAGATIKAALKPLVLPGIELMQIQIGTAIKKEILVLEKMAEKVADKPFALTGIVAKIRELNYILHNLAHATFETIKGWWMKFVHKSS